MSADALQTKIKLTSNVGKSRYNQSLAYGAQIEQIIPGGVDSPFRAFHEVGGQAIFFKKGLGSKLYDLDNNEYIDYLGAWGPAILGHCPPAVIARIQEVLADGPVFGAPHILEMEMARAVIDICPSIQKIRFVSSGTEAVMSALRLARGFSGREKIIMFEGGYHGHSDATLASDKHQSSSGIAAGSISATLLARYNDLASVEQLFEQHRDRIGTVIVEPVCGSMGVVPPQPGFLQGLRRLCDSYGAVLIFDEVITGLRLALGGAQSYFDVRPDLTCFGKALGGGMPIGAYGGRADIMQKLIPDGDVYQAGTFSGNPVTMSGGIATIKALRESDAHAKMENSTTRLFKGLQTAVDKHNWPVQLQRVGSMFAVLFTDKAVNNYQDSLSIDHSRFSAFFHYLLDHGIYMPPSGVDAACLSAAHSESDIDSTIQIMTDAMQEALKNKV